MRKLSVMPISRETAMTKLFRQEAVRHATRRLEGEVLLATPLSIKTLGLFLAVITFLAVAFLFSATYARKTTITGLLVPDQGMVRVTSKAAGILQNIMVKEGDTVTTGVRIAELNLAAETERGNVGETMAKGLLAESLAARAKAEATLARLRIELEQHNNRLAKSGAEQDQIKTQITLQEQRVELAQIDLQRALAVSERGIVTRKEVDTRSATLLQMQQELATFRRLLATSERELADVQARVASIPFEMEAARAETESAAATLQQRTAESEARQRQFVTAPVSGRIAALPVSTGQSINAGSAVAVIIPEGGKLEAELLAPSRAIGFVRPGQEVKIILQAFPYQRFGTLSGQIRTVSTTVIAPSEVAIQGLNIQEPTFRIRVRALSRDYAGLR